MSSSRPSLPRAPHAPSGRPRAGVPVAPRLVPRAVVPRAVVPRAVVPRAVAALLLAAACRRAPTQSPEQGEAQRSPQPAPTAGVVRAVVVARGLVTPWGMAVLPDGRALVTERPGRLRVVSLVDGAVSAPVAGVPAVWANGQGGLLDVALDPQFATTRLVYLSFSEPGSDGTAGTAVARARLNDTATALEGTTVIYRQTPKVSAGQHFGGRLAFDRAGRLWVTQGDRGTPKAGESAQSQRLDGTIGKVVRLAPDGTVPPDNPFVGRAGARPEIFSVGHRNAQAAAVEPTSGVLWTVEHGARGGDELNRVVAGRNYGWPVITYGVDYDGTPIGVGTARAGLEQPVYYWDPIIAPSGATFVRGDRYPGWNGSLVVGGLASRVLVRLAIDGAAGPAPRVTREERHLAEFNRRIRAVVQAPDGWLYVLTDDDDGVLARVVPAAGG